MSSINPLNKFKWMLATACLGSTLAFAQSYPTKPIRLIIPWPPGGTTDVLGRMAAQRLTEAWGAQVLADNRPGAGGNIGFQACAKSPPDGYTLCIMTVAQAISPSIYKQLGFDPSADFSHVTLMAVVPSLLLVHPSLPVKNVQQFVALAKAKPGHLSYASTGNGTSTHMMMEMLKTMTKIDIVHIPYKGVSLAIVDQISGLVESSFGTAIGTLPFVRQGKIRALAVSTRDRFPPLPDLQTMQESGIKGFEASSWTGMSMPAGTPLEIVRKVNQELTGMLRTPGIRARLLEMGGIVVADTPEEFSAFVKRDTEQWAKVAKAANVQIN